MLRCLAVLLSLGFVLSACAFVPTAQVAVTRAAIPQSLVTQAQGDLRNMMKDPESAKFRNAVTYRSALGDQIICGEYDARNGFGGYSGYETYYYRFRAGALLFKWIDSNGSEYFKPAGEACRQATAGVIALPASQVPGTT